MNIALYTIITGGFNVNMSKSNVKMYKSKFCEREWAWPLWHCVTGGWGGLMDWDSSHTRTQTDKPHSFLLSFGKYFSLNLLWDERFIGGDGTQPYKSYVCGLWICHVFFKMKRLMDSNTSYSTRQALHFDFLTDIFRGWKVQEHLSYSVDFSRFW